jgi:hypothetical protein
MAKKNPAAVALALLRAKRLSPQRRSEIAREGAAARTKALSAKERKAIAKGAAAARWSRQGRMKRSR